MSDFQAFLLVAGVFLIPLRCAYLYYDGVKDVWPLCFAAIVVYLFTIRAFFSMFQGALP